MNSKETTLRVNESGVQIVRNGEDLRDILEDFMNETNKMNAEAQKIATKAGAADSVPILAASFTKTELIIQRLKAVLTTE